VQRELRGRPQLVHPVFWPGTIVYLPSRRGSGVAHGPAARDRILARFPLKLSRMRDPRAPSLGGARRARAKAPCLAFTRSYTE
jgi:hypothetical protein